MALSLGGLVSGIQSLLGQVVTALRFTSTAATATDAFSVANNGARTHFGTGASDYASSDGTTVTFASLVSAAGIVEPIDAWWWGAGNTGAAGTGAFKYGSGGNGYEFYGLGMYIQGKLNVTGAVIWSSFLDDSANPGNRTVNTTRGISAFGAGVSTITITNSLVTATSTVLAVIQTNDATALLKNVVPGASNFVLTLNANTTGITKVSWVVIN
jgi:hypothetical protein